LVPLAKACERAGHQVAFATAPGFTEAVRGLGFEAHAVGPDWETDPDILRVRGEHLSHSGPDHVRFALQNLFIRTASMKTLPDMRRLVEAWQPDAIVWEITECAGLIIGELMGVPRVQVSFGIDPSAELARYMVGTALDELRVAAGLAPDPDLIASRSGLRLHFAMPLGPGSYALRPEPFDRMADEALPGWMDELPERPVVYATLGTVFADTPGLFETIADGLADEPVNVIATVSRDVDPARLRGRAPNLRVEQYIPNSLLLPRCRAVVAHAGYGTVMGCLAIGVPMVLIPLGADQFMHAERCRALDVAETVLREEAGPERIRRAVQRILADPEFAHRARAMREEIAAMPGADRGASRVEQAARTSVRPSSHP
jgi:UDP:flavonoid glycosyltransferase YjiC (YdhE family)